MRRLGGLLVLVAALPLVHCSGWSGGSAAPQAISAETFEQLRLDMVRRQIEARGVKDPAVLEAMTQVPRHEFVSDASAPKPMTTTPCRSAKARRSRSPISWPS